MYYGSQYGPLVVNNPVMTGQSQRLLTDVQPSANQPSGSGFVPPSYGQRTAQGGRNWSYRGSGRSIDVRIHVVEFRMTHVLDVLVENIGGRSAHW